MKVSVLDKLHQRYFTYDQALKASEDWSERTKKNPSFKKLISVQSKFELALRKHWRSQSNNTDQFVNWSAYAIANVTSKTAAKITVTNDDGSSYISAIDSSAFVSESALLLAIMEEYILQGMGLGVTDANDIYVDSGLSITSEAIQKYAIDESSKLVTQITDTTRARIQQAVATSIKLGEPIAQATARVSNVIDDPNRSEMIARTETRNSYVDGQNTVAKSTGATMKEWDPSSDPCELCQENVDDGQISIDDDFTNGDEPHPNCLCGAPVFIYPNSDDSDSEDNN
jgi:hypothetical protein